jgi:hypothetical protein
VSENSQLNKTAVMLNMASQAGCMMPMAAVLVIAIAFGSGYLLDTILDTGNVFTLILLVGSFPVTLFVMIQLGLRLQLRMKRQLIELEKKQTEEEVKQQQLAEEEDKQT